MNAAILEALEVLGPDRVKLGADIPERNWADVSGLAPQRPAALILPRNTDEVSRAVAICHRHRQPIVTQGGMTGAAGGAQPVEGEIALSLERMSAIEEIDGDSFTLTAMAGTTLQVIQEAAEDAGMLCGIDLGARGSATIGGIVSTNAGGNQVLRYGMARKNILGLEVVLADGTVVRSLNKMTKNNTGYDWTQLFIGSEGTLGVVTKVVLGLHARPRHVHTAILAVASTADALKVLRLAESALPGGLLVFEQMWREFYEIATTLMELPAPIPAGHDAYILLEASSADATTEALEAFLGQAYESGLIADAVIAKSSSERNSLWALRESCYNYSRVLPRSISFDISIPLNRMSEAVEKLRCEIPALGPDITWVVFGHLADANVHVMVMPPIYSNAVKAEVDRLVYRITAALGGSISAEHGIGRTKTTYLPLSRTAEELSLMAGMKKMLDPEGILNPGRII